jgi:hypothetical protein
MASIRIQATYSPAWQRAAARAAVNAKAGRRAERVAPHTYRVASSQREQSYTCHVTSIVHLQAECTCPAGVAGLVCWHMAASVTAAIAHCRAAAPVAAPVAAPDPAEIARKARLMDQFKRAYGAS